MSKNNEEFKVRAATYEVKDPKGLAGFVLKLKGEAVQDLINELKADSYGKDGATVFLNIYENDSTINAGTKYLSTVLGVKVSDAPKEESVGNQIRNKYQARR